MAQEADDLDNDLETPVIENWFTWVEPVLIEVNRFEESLDWNSYGPGISAGDFDNDGDLDLYVSAKFSYLDSEDSQSSTKSIKSSFGYQRLFENKGDFSFKDITNKSGLYLDNNEDGIPESTSLSGVWGDYDSDGFLDLYVSQYGHINGKYAGGEANILYHNNRDGTFTDVTNIAGVGNEGHSSNAQWVDYDHDGDLDLYSLNYGIFGESELEAEGETNILYRNNGDGTFSDVTFEARLSGSYVFSDTNGEPLKTDVVRADMVAGTSSSNFNDESDAGSGMSWAALWIDYDGDGWEDVFIASDLGISPLYRNNGDGTFSVATSDAGMNINGAGRGLDAGDYDRDGDLDICQSNRGSNYLWQNQGDGTYIEVGEEIGIVSSEATPANWACEFFDYDLDGDLDLFFSVGQINPYFSNQDNTFWVNQGNGTFTEKAYELNLIPSHFEKTQGVSIADFDNDGDLDIITGNSNSRIRFFENHADLTGRHWLMIELNGTYSNIQGIGANVTLLVGDQLYVQQKFACSGSFGCSEERLHFGLGNTTIVDSIVVNWPSGRTTVMYDVPVDQVIVIPEYVPKPPDLVAFSGILFTSLFLFIWRHKRM